MVGWPSGPAVRAPLLFDAPIGMGTRELEQTLTERLTTRGLNVRYVKARNVTGYVQLSALYYDVPKLTNPATLELHESCHDKGTVVELSQATKAKDS